MISPFTSPPPPYSPQHPHVILDHEKIPQGSTPPPPHSLVDPAARTISASPKPRGLGGEDEDIFHLPPTTALTWLSRSMELLVSLTGDVPPTPPSSNSSPGFPELKPLTSLESSSLNGFCFGNLGGNDDLEGVIIKRRTSSSEYSGEGHIIQAGFKDGSQYGAITRKFWSKAAPEIAIEDYLFRIHRFCPLSTAVYLAASLYLHRLAVVDRVIPITRMNVHRLLLAALRVASKGLEDLNYPQKRFAKVCGLSENELGRLEVCFCFLTNFDLKVDRAALEKQVVSLRESVNLQVNLGTSGLVLPSSGPKAIEKPVVKEKVMLDV